MKWMTEVPVGPGWYWWRKRPGKAPVVVELAESERDGDPDRRLIRRDVDERVPSDGTYGRGEWWGPLAEPEG